MEGLAKVIPVPLLSLFSSMEFRVLVCGHPDIPLEMLKSVAVYKGIEATAPLVSWWVESIFIETIKAKLGSLFQ